MPPNVITYPPDRAALIEEFAKILGQPGRRERIECGLRSLSLSGEHARQMAAELAARMSN